MAIQWVIVCEQETAPLANSAPGAAPVWNCPAANHVIITTDQLVQESSFIASYGSFDPVAAGAFFGLAFTSTIFLWLLSLGAGAIIRMVKSA